MTKQYQQGAHKLFSKKKINISPVIFNYSANCNTYKHFFIKRMSINICTTSGGNFWDQNWTKIQDNLSFFIDHVRRQIKSAKRDEKKDKNDFR